MRVRVSAHQALESALSKKKKIALLEERERRRLGQVQARTLTYPQAKCCNNHQASERKRRIPLLCLSNISCTVCCDFRGASARASQSLIGSIGAGMI